MTTAELTQLITALRNEIARDAISPETVGNILQKIVDKTSAEDLQLHEDVTSTLIVALSKVSSVSFDSVTGVLSTTVNGNQTTIGSISVFRGAYSSSTRYYNKNSVRHNDILWNMKSTESVIGVEPGTNNNVWEKVTGATVTQTTGNSTQLVMSQKAVSDAIIAESRAREDAIELEQNSRISSDQALRASIEQLEAKQIMAITLDQTTGILSLHYDNNSNVTDVTLGGVDGKLRIVFEI